MAPKLIAGNWKMNGTRASLAEARAIAAASPAGGGGVARLICPPFTLIAAMAEVVQGAALGVGGQNCHARSSGAHTGDVSAEMLADAGASHVILGHSERRADHGETDANVAAKAEAALRAGLVPIICVGETLAQREAGAALSIVCGQIAASLPNACEGRAFVVANEHDWAIGTGRTHTPAQNGDENRAIRAALLERFGKQAEAAPILYGGSMKPTNAREILAVPNVDGGLVGGASLTAADFLAICDAAG